MGKYTGETAHVEHWNNTLRQRLARFVRKTLSFSIARTVNGLSCSRDPLPKAKVALEAIKGQKTGKETRYNS
jgi:hypothetical protein